MLDYEDPNKVVEGPFEGWIFNDAYSGVMFCTDLHRTVTGVVCWDWQDHQPEVEGHFTMYRRREVYATRLLALAGLKQRYERRIKRSEAFIAKIDRALLADPKETQ